MYNKHLHNLRISISAIAIIAAMFFANNGNVYSQNPCPQGYGTPTTSIIYICDGACQIEVTWCCAPGVTSLFPRLYIHSFRFLQNPDFCPCVGWISQQPPLPSYPSVPISELISGIISSPEVNCFTPYIGMIDTCGGSNPTNVQVSNGGCYEYVETNEIWEFVPCGNPQITECHLYYTVCKKYINGEWVLKIIPSSPRIPTFICPDPECIRLCDVLTD